MKKSLKEQKFAILKTVLLYILTFVISVSVGIIVYIKKEISPFGENSLLAMDLWGQYFPMYIQQAKAESFSQLLYSWNGAFGYNNWAQNAYYCNSIFLIIMKLIPVEKMIAALDVICLIKIGLSSMSCLAFLQYKTNKKSPILIAGGVSYGLCAYMLAFMSQFMWTDTLIYLPLVLIGLERLVFKKKPVMYTLILGLTICSNFYIGFAVCIFSVLYFICINFQHLSFGYNEKSRLSVTGGKIFGRSILRFIGYSLLGGALSAIVIIPVGMAIGNTIASEIEAPTSIEWYKDITAYLQFLLPETPLKMEYSGANIATTILVFAMIPLYFYNKKIRFSEKIANGALLVFLFASLNCNILDYMWHGFHFPNQLPGRWSFMVSLVIILLCSQAIANIEGITPWDTVKGAVISFLSVKIICNGLDGQESVLLDSDYISYLFIAEILIFAITFLIQKITGTEKALQTLEKQIAEESENQTAEKSEEQTMEESENQITEESEEQTAEESEKQIINPLENKKSRYQRRILVFRCATVCFTVILSALQIYDSASNFINVAQFEKHGLPTSSATAYIPNLTKNAEYGKEWKNGDDDFYRVEPYSGYTFNPSMLGDFHGMGYYSSTMQGTVFELLRFLGNRVYAQNVSSVYNISSPVQNSLFGVKYFLDYNKSIGYAIPDIELIQENENCNIWENPTALPIAFASSNDVFNFNITDQIRAIKNQNDFLNSICGRKVDVFKPLSCTNFHYENLTLQENSNWNYNYFVTKNTSSPAVFNYQYTIEEDSPIYIEHNFRAGTIKASWNGNEKNIPVGGERYCYLGEIKAGTVVSIKVSVENVSLGCCGLNVYKFDKTAWNDAYNQLSSQQIDVREFDTTSIKGEITMKQESLLFTSIAQDGGWKAYCDGEEIKTVLIADALVGIKVPEGTHTIEFKYSVPGLALGSTISIVAILLIVWFSYPQFRQKIFSKNQTQSTTDDINKE